MDIYQLGPKASQKPLIIDSEHLNAGFFEDSSRQYLVLITPQKFAELSDLFKFPERAVLESLDQDQFPQRRVL